MMGAFFAHLIPDLRVLAREAGYALTVHGSMSTDLDLVAIPWTESAIPAADLVEKIRARLNGIIKVVPWNAQPEVRPHGRLAWSIYLDKKSAKLDMGPYIDVSVMPRLPDTPVDTP